MSSGDAAAPRASSTSAAASATPTPARMLRDASPPIRSGLYHYSRLDAFLVFKRAMGHPYVRAEFTLRSFDRFVVSYARRHRPFRLDNAILAWLASIRRT